jgi:hypothetical protein
MRHLAKVVLVCAVFCVSQVNAEPVVLGLQLQEGATYNWVSVNERATDSAKGKQSSKATTPFSLQVLRASKDAFLLELGYGKSELAMPAENPEAQRMLSDLQEIVQSLKFRVVVDNRGQILDLQNFEEVQAAVKNLIDKLAASTKNGLPEQVKAQLQAMFSTKQAIVGAMLKDLPLLFVGASADPNAKAPIRFESEMPNPFGGAPFKTSGVTTVSRLPESKHTLKLETRQSVKAESVAQLISQMAQGKMSKVDEENMRKQLKGMSIKDSLKATVDLNTGLSSQVRFVRTTTLQDTKRVDTKEFSLVN